MSLEPEKSPADTLENDYADANHIAAANDGYTSNPESPTEAGANSEAEAEEEEGLDDLFGGGNDSEPEDVSSGEQVQTTGIASMPKIPKRKTLTSKSQGSASSQREKNSVPATSHSEDEEEASAAAETPLAPAVDPKQAEIDEINRQIEAALKSGRSRRRKRTDDDDAAIDEMIVELRKRMRDAAYRDIDDNKDRLPAIHKLSMLSDVVEELGKTQLYEAFLDNNIVDSIRLWLEPLDDGSLPSLDIQNAMLDVLKRLPIRRDHLRESGIGKIILFMSKCPRIPERNRRLCEQFVQQWSRMVLRLSADFRDRKIRETSVDLSRRKLGSSRATAVAVEASQRRVPGGIRVESGSGRDGERSTARIPQRVAADYTVMPVSSLSLSTNQQLPNRNTNVKYKKLKQAMSKSGR
ncbi:Transcription factor iws1 [Coemansia erecta]|uniref:Transcription factor iws1 n=1 Tax=Coemansia asiatica TaxID=1052880 RepID=A0A9W7XJQ9_9FUNG|nr:Transcription factor iws1 [Coemansia asiatica]KAJ2843583.1 Transcription factor iws1 [Coemansia erecta]KAJ2887510.1 Transcription factor iws1 [Coemansia asiatica]